MKIFSIALLSLLTSLLPLQMSKEVRAEEPFASLERGTITGVEILEERKGNESTQGLDVTLAESDEVISVINNPTITGRPVQYNLGDQVMIGSTGNGAQEIAESAQVYYIADFNRTRVLAGLSVLFVIVTILVAGKRGALTIFSTAFSVGVIYFLALPRIISGNSAVGTIILASIVIIPVSFYTAHGFSRKTHVAVASTFLSLVGAGLLSWLAVSMARMTGFSTDEAMFLNLREGQINMRGVLLAGLLIGFLGILDDVTISQSGLVTQLKKADPNLGSLDLYQRGMEVGKDHVTSMVNTLVLVYTGASLPMILLFYSTQAPILDAINSEMLAEEIVRTLLGSIALVLAIPLSTLLASVMVEAADPRTK